MSSGALTKVFGTSTSCTIRATEFSGGIACRLSSVFFAGLVLHEANGVIGSRESPRILKDAPCRTPESAKCSST